MHTSNTENREQTFDEKLDAIFSKIFMTNAGNYSPLVVEAKQAIKTLVLEDVVGEDVDKDNWGWKNYTDSIRAINIILAEQRRIINPQKEVK